MEVLDLVKALLSYEALAAREWVADAQRTGFAWSMVSAPKGLDPVATALAASVTELMAARAGEEPPEWTSRVPPAPEKIYLVRAAASMPRLRKLCETEGPAALRRRGFLAPPEFLTIA